VSISIAPICSAIWRSDSRYSKRVALGVDDRDRTEKASRALWQAVKLKPAEPPKG
jgi:hypothetical protein